MTAGEGKARWLMPAIAVAATLLRLLPFLRAGGPWSWPVDYDEGVYFAASALIRRGVLPYRDFVFVHPPGLLYFLGLVAWMPMALSNAFAASRVMAAIVGGVNTLLVGRIAGRERGTFAAAVAAALYATYPDAVVAERGPYLEMALNLACLGLAYVWLADGARKRRSIVAGLLCAASSAVKVWGGIWFLAALASAPRERWRRETLTFLATGAIAGALLLAPLALTAPARFFEQTVRFHAWRPPDGTTIRAARWLPVAAQGHTIATALAAIALAVAAAHLVTRRSTRTERFFAVAVLLTLAAFFASSSYWIQYNAHLAASECVLAGIGAAAAAEPLRRLLHRTAAVIAATVIVALVAAPSLMQVLDASRARAPELLALGATIRENVAADDCLFAFEPQWSLVADRLPPHDRAPVLVDVYGAMLLDAVRGGRKFPDAETAFHSPAAQPQIRARLERCRFTILGWRGNWQMSPETRTWFRSNFVCDTPAAGDLCLFERWTPSHLGMVFVPPGANVTFANGWYGEEGTLRQAWCWMGARSTTLLPDVGPRARLTLDLEIATPARPPQITVMIDGKEIGRFAMSAPTETRSWVVATNGGAHTLELRTTQTFNPSRQTGSADARDLGIRLNRLVWIPAAPQAPSRDAASARDGAAATSSPR